MRHGVRIPEGEALHAFKTNINKYLKSIIRCKRSKISPPKYASIAVSATESKMRAMLQHFQEHLCWHRLSMWNRDGEYGEYWGPGFDGRRGNTGITTGGAEGADTSIPPPAVWVELSAEPSLKTKQRIW